MMESLGSFVCNGYSDRTFRMKVASENASVSTYSRGMQKDHNQNVDFIFARFRLEYPSQHPITIILEKYQDLL